MDELAGACIDFLSAPFGLSGHVQKKHLSPVVFHPVWFGLPFLSVSDLGAGPAHCWQYGRLSVSGTEIAGCHWYFQNCCY